MWCFESSRKLEWLIIWDGWSNKKKKWKLECWVSSLSRDHKKDAFFFLGYLTIYHNGTFSYVSFKERCKFATFLQLLLRERCKYFCNFCLRRYQHGLGTGKHHDALFFSFSFLSSPSYPSPCLPTECVLWLTRVLIQLYNNSAKVYYAWMKKKR